MSTSTWVAFLRGINVGGSSGHRKPQPPRDPDVEALNRIKAARESFVLRGDAFYLHAPDGIGKSKLAARAEKLLGATASARNWRTIATVLEMARPPR